MTLLEKIDRLPPFLVFALAREHGKRPSLNVLVERSGIPPRTFMRIASHLTWRDVKLGLISRFSAACGVDLVHQSKQFEYLRTAARRGTVFSHLTPHQRELVEEKMRRYRALKG